MKWPLKLVQNYRRSRGSVKKTHAMFPIKIPH